MRRPVWFRGLVVASLAVVLIGSALGLAGCDSSDDAEGAAASADGFTGVESGDVEGSVGETIAVAEINITVKALAETFQPARPAQRLSSAGPSAPGPGESLYQAYVRVQNLGTSPVRVDPEDFACLVGDRVVSIEPALSGPPARSLLKNTSLDVVLTFKAAAGHLPELFYDPAWYNGTIHVIPAPEGQTVEGDGPAG